MAGPNQDATLSHRDAGVRGYGAKLRLISPRPLDGAEARELASGFMAQTASACLAGGAKLIGHIKSIIKTEAGSIKADILGRPDSLFVAGDLDRPVTRLDLTINCIVQGLGEDRLASITMAALEKSAGERGLDMERVEGRSYDPLAQGIGHSGHAHDHGHHGEGCHHCHQHGHGGHTGQPLKTPHDAGPEET